MRNRKVKLKKAWNEWKGTLIIGIPGDKIAILNNQIILNGKPQIINQDDICCDFNLRNIITSENLAGKTHLIMFTPKNKSLKFFNPTTVPDDSYFVMGDNRDNSFDSRYFGFIKRDSIIGQGTAVVLSFNRVCTKFK
ncbi:MAG: signal peptidase I [Victivallaceae bacterium]|nr:signal peptidase I [Victivallaceae bacterium]